MGDRLVLKGHRKLKTGASPELEMGLHLAEVVQYPNCAPLAGVLEYIGISGERRVLAILQSFIPNQGDGWTYSLEYLRRHLEQHRTAPASDAPPLNAHEGFLDMIRTLARRTAELHIALAAHTGNAGFDPEPLERADYDGYRQRALAEARSAFALLKANIDSVPAVDRQKAADVLTQEKHIIKRLEAPLNEMAGAIKIRIHGDFHLGQVLVTRNDFVIVDFEGEPGAGITTIEPPEPNARGTASLHYPIETPPGRNGIGPKLALTYDSDRVNSNGWLGVGWDLRMSSIEVDTRFGAPRYDGSEIYTLDGEMLTPTDTSSGITTYIRRVESSFDLIQRKNAGPTSYSWTVTDKSGTVYTYGSAPASRLADPRVQQGNIFRWYLDKVQDTYGNFMTIGYTHDANSLGTAPNAEPFDEVYPATIDYTAGPGVTAAYHVTFDLDAVGTRPDTTSSGRSGSHAISSEPSATRQCCQKSPSPRFDHAR